MTNMNLAEVVIERLTSNNLNDCKLSLIDFLDKSLFICVENDDIDIDNIVNDLVCFPSNNNICNTIKNDGAFVFPKEISNCRLKWSTIMKLNAIDWERPLVDMLSNKFNEDSDALTFYWAIYERVNDFKTDSSRMTSIISVVGDPIDVYRKLYVEEKIRPCFVYIDANVSLTSTEANNKSNSRLFMAIESANYIRRPSIICKECNLEWKGYEKQNESYDNDISLWVNNYLNIINDPMPRPTKKIIKILNIDKIYKDHLKRY